MLIKCKDEKNQSYLTWVATLLSRRTDHKTGKIINKSMAVQTPLSQERMVHFRQQLHPKQLCLYEEVLAPLLGLFNRTYQQERDSDKGLTALTLQLVALNRLLTEEGQWEVQPSRNRVLTVMVLCRAIIDLQKTYHLEHPLFSEANIGVGGILRRLSPKVFLLVGADYWRFYELYTVVYGNVKTLILNRDCIAILHTLFPTIKASETEATIEDQQRLTTMGAMDIAKTFQRWLASKITHQRATYRLNEGDYCFAQPLAYKNCIFVTEPLFTHYQCVKQIDPAVLKRALIDAHISDGKHYLIEGTPPRDATRIQGIPVDNTLLAVVTIAEKDHES